MSAWSNEPRGKQLEAFVGAYGIKTNQFKSTKELIWFACRLFGIDPVDVKTVEEAADQIEALGKKERSARARQNREIIFPLQDFKNPADAPVTHEGLLKMMADSSPKLVDGAGQDCVGELDIDPARLLKKVVSAVISAGQGHILYEFPELLEFMGSRIPKRSEVAHLHNVDERLFEAKEKWPNLNREGWQ